MKNLERRVLHIALLYLHLALQIAAGYWSIILDWYTCQDQYLRNLSYFCYAFILLNLLFIAYINSRDILCGNYVLYIVLLTNLGLVAGLLYMDIEGFVKNGYCAAARVLFQVAFGEIVIAIVLSICTVVGSYPWIDRYLHWPGNIVWAIMFLKSGFPGILSIPAIIIGIIYLLISCTGFTLNLLTYNQHSLQSPTTVSLYKIHWILSIILIIALEILVIVLCAGSEKDGDYYWNYGRRVSVVFIGINVVDVGFWTYGWRRFKFWSIVA